MKQIDIDRDKARALAGVAIAPREIGEVRSIEEVEHRRVAIYGFPETELSNYWIAYVERDSLWGIRSSTVVLVEKAGGRIAYVGSAGDEG